uniref:Uncharacterized protein n=1 Tax=Monodelphis domestica TaxID=13616 RepID=A0A5F8H5Z3_MONDO
MALDQGHCPRDPGARDGEMGKSRKLALITGITGQESCIILNKRSPFTPPKEKRYNRINIRHGARKI